MKNKLSDLNNHLFAQIERLSDEELTAEKLKEEIERGRAITTIANSIIENAKVSLEAAIAIHQNEFSKVPPMLTNEI